MSLPLFKQDESYKQLISEVSSLSGYPQNVCKEVFEFLVLNYAIKICETPDDFADLEIPFVGTLKVKYDGDELNSLGKLKTNVQAYVNLKESFETLVGDLHDEGMNDLVSLFQKKIENSVMVASKSGEQLLAVEED